MPKMKTRTGAKARFKVTGTGKIRRRRHQLRRSATVARETRKDIEVKSGDHKKIKRLLGL